MFIVRDKTEEFFVQDYFYKKEENAYKKFREIITNFFYDEQNEDVYDDLMHELREEGKNFYDYLNECVDRGECYDVADIDLIPWEDE